MFAAGLALLAAVPLTRADPVFDPQCSTEGYEELIRATDALVVERSEPAVPYDYFSAIWKRACVLITFEIDDSGLASGIEIVNYFPGPFIQRVGLKAIESFRFSKDGNRSRGAIRIEISENSLRSDPIPPDTLRQGPEQ